MTAPGVPVRRIFHLLKDANMGLLEGPGFHRIVTGHTLLAFATVLGPRRAQASVSDEALEVVSETAQINKYNMALFVLEGLKVAAYKVRDEMPSNPSSIELEGCVIALQIALVEHRRFGLRGLFHEKKPRIEDYIEGNLKETSRLVSLLT